MAFNPLHAIDFYKADHRRQYPKGTTMVYSNFTARSNKLSNLPDQNDSVVFFGLQYFVKNYLIHAWNTGFFNRPKDEVVKAYKRRMDNALGKDAIPTDHIEALHDLGYLPLEIKAVPEGSSVSIKVPCLTVHNTHPDFFWLVNYIESVMSCALWKPCVNATTARWYKQRFDAYALLTGSPADFTQFQGHDFSFRGMSGTQDACVSGAAHLLSFSGTDTVPAIDFLEEYYGADSDKELIGCSVPATEHSVMCMGSKENEIETYRRLLTEVYPSGIVSVVSDTWDFWAVLTDFMPKLKDLIMAREGKLVIRPDSGDPVKIICGYPIVEKDRKYDFVIGETYAFKEKDGKWYEFFFNGWDWGKGEVLSEAEVKGAIELLWDVFGGTVTEIGYKLLDSHIGLIYGDSITPQRAEDILSRLMKKGFASGNVVLGIGSYTYQHVTRDTYGFAVKSTYGEIEGKGFNIFKDPKTDNGVKKSAKGLIRVIDGVLHDEQDGHDGGDLQTVFMNGALVREVTLAEMRENIKQ